MFIRDIIAKGNFPEKAGAVRLRFYQKEWVVLQFKNHELPIGIDLKNPENELGEFFWLKSSSQCLIALCNGIKDGEPNGYYFYLVGSVEEEGKTINFCDRIEMRSRDPWREILNFLRNEDEAGFWDFLKPSLLLDIERESGTKAEMMRDLWVLPLPSNSLLDYISEGKNGIPEMKASTRAFLGLGNLEECQQNSLFSAPPKNKGLDPSYDQGLNIFGQRRLFDGKMFYPQLIQKGNRFIMAEGEIWSRDFSSAGYCWYFLGKLNHPCVIAERKIFKENSVSLYVPWIYEKVRR